MDTDGATRYYRQQADALGGKLLRLQRALTDTQRDLHRQRSVAASVRTLFNAAREGRSLSELNELLLTLLIESTRTDRIALARCRVDHRPSLEHSLGMPDRFGTLFAGLPAIPVTSDDEAWPGETWTQAFAMAADLSDVRHVAHPSSGLVLLFGTPPERRMLQDDFGPPDRAATTAVLEVYAHIRELIQTETALRRSESRYRAIFDEVNDGIALFDATSRRLLDANAQACRLLDIAPETIGSALDVLPLGNDASAVVQWKRHFDLACSGLEQQIELRARSGEGDWHVVDFRLTHAIINDQPRLIGVARDITQRKAAEEQLRHGALHDPLTGLPNRSLLLDRLQQAMQRQYREPDYRFALVFMDIDRFKLVNDSLGHGTGDVLLTAIAQRLADVIRPNDTLARLGGDEFVVLLADLATGATEVGAIAERLQSVFAAPYVIDGREMFSSASIGITLSGPGYHGPNDMLRDADIAMYHAKARGTGSYEVFRPEMHQEVVERLQLEGDLRRAIARDELRVHYQPLIDLASNRLSGFEALVRWQHPERGLLYPGAFIETAEDSGLIDDIGVWMLQHVVDEVAGWLTETAWTFTVSVNLSPKQLATDRLIGLIDDLLSSHPGAADWLHLEVTESALMSNTLLASEILHELRGRGLRISMDDFGTGYSSLNYLQQFPIDILKIDRSFVNRMLSSPSGLQMVSTIIQLGHNLGMEVVAEGIEHAEQAVELKRLGCDHGQGFYLSRPMPAKQARHWVLESPTLPDLP
jgi:diguanylate cyclase (GGDEF)-like protein/PAS domain S-box-containing protein